MPSTARTRLMYKRILFPDCETMEQMDEVLHRGDTLDAGSGTTINNPYSLYNHLRESGKMVGVDLRNAEVKGGPDGFTINDSIKARLINAFSDMHSLLRFQSAKRGKSDSNEAVKADLKSMPFEDSSFSQILSVYCYPYWIDDEIDREIIFSELDRVLEPKGQMRFCSDRHRLGRTLLDSGHIRKSIRDRYKVDTYDPRGYGGLADSMGNKTLVLTKNN
tara:strand:+ start:194 stop:850 length:657 start_codon:yes stop_codon:yes gene_type:complete